MLQELMREFDVPPERLLMIGDTTHDLQMALNAGCASVGVSYGAHEPDGFHALKPRFVDTRCANCMTGCWPTAERPAWKVMIELCNSGDLVDGGEAVRSTSSTTGRPAGLLPSGSRAGCRPTSTAAAMWQWKWTSSPTVFLTTRASG
jgi:hypothetical protein